MDALGKLTGGVAHDYNNMLAIISGFAHLLQTKLSQQPALLEFVNHIVHASARGATLTKKLLAFSRHRSDDATSTDINSLIRCQQQMLDQDDINLNRSKLKIG